MIPSIARRRNDIEWKRKHIYERMGARDQVVSGALVILRKDRIRGGGRDRIKYPSQSQQK